MTDLYKIYPILSLNNVRLGAYYDTDGICFVFEIIPEKECGVIIYPDSSNIPVKITFPKEVLHGKIAAAKIVFDKSLGIITDTNDILIGNGLRYLLFSGENVYPDPYMTAADGFGDFGQETSVLSRVDSDNKSYSTAFEHPTNSNRIYYMLHVRGFTAHSSSKVKNPGTFSGVISKLQYINDLGVSTIILMPIYEYNERIISQEGVTNIDSNQNKINFWGYTDGYYYLPKTSFSSNNNAIEEFHLLIENAHSMSMEILLQFWFPDFYSARKITDILRFWSERYNVDGFQLVGSGLPIEDIMSDPFLYGRIILYDASIDCNINEYTPTIGYLNNHYMNNIRQFLKGDPNTAFTAAMHIREYDSKKNNINYLARQDTMRLYDIVSYNEKHNEDNGENGCDGADYNFSWNCGYEGPTKRKNVIQLRTKQFKNALTILLMSQGNPLIYSGDEFGNTQYGNNNPYNQDNAIGYVKWSNSVVSKDFLAFFKILMQIRKSHPCLGSGKQLCGRDYLSFGYPDVSFHGSELWKSDLGSTSHSFGMLLSDYYADKNDKRMIFVLFNMHWEKQELAIPKLKNQMKWKLSVSTDEKNTLLNTQSIEMQPRSICILETIL